MTVTAVRKDSEKLTVTLDAAFAASPERVWQLWADPRRLESVGGAPTLPGHGDDSRAAIRRPVVYHMTGPEGDGTHGSWEILEVARPIASSSAMPSPTPTARRTPTCRSTTYA